MPIIYISGPYRASSRWAQECNCRNAEDVALEVAKLGCIPLCPHTMYRHFDGTLTDEYWLEATKQLLLRCDGMLQVAQIGEDGRRSEGTEIEEDLAMEQEIPFAYSIENLEYLLSAGEIARNRARKEAKPK